MVEEFAVALCGFPANSDGGAGYSHVAGVPLSMMVVLEVASSRLWLLRATSWHLKD
jgi:hypothetical protein